VFEKRVFMLATLQLVTANISSGYTPVSTINAVPVIDEN
jgi:hypothetical protein